MKMMHWVIFFVFEPSLCVKENFDENNLNIIVWVYIKIEFLIYFRINIISKSLISILYLVLILSKIHSTYIKSIQVQVVNKTQNSISSKIIQVFLAQI